MDGCGLGDANSRGPSYQCSLCKWRPLLFWVLQLCVGPTPGARITPCIPFLPFKLYFISPSYSLLTAAFIWAVYPSTYSFIHSINTYDSILLSYWHREYKIPLLYPSLPTPGIFRLLNFCKLETMKWNSNVVLIYISLKTNAFCMLLSLFCCYWFNCTSFF